MLSFFKKKKGYETTANAMAAIEKLIKLRLMKVNVNNYQVQISRELCWDGKGTSWQNSMLVNIHTYIGIKRALQKQEHKDLPITLIDISTKKTIIEKQIK